MGTELSLLTQSKHVAELELVKARTLAEVYKLEIERLERVLLAKQAPAEGGFLPMMPPEPVQEPEPSSDAQNFASRLDEVFGEGLPLAEIERRHQAHREQELSELFAERDRLRTEIQKIPQ
jgi:hypothetical protein